MTLINNVKWVSFSQITKVLCQVVGLFVFSRFLSPSELGVMSLTLIVVNFINILRDMGSSAAIIQRDILTEGLKNSIFVLNSILGIVLCILTILFSEKIAIFFHEPILAETLKIISIAFVINSVTSAHLALLERDSKFNRVAFVEVISSLISLVMAIICAANGLGVFSLVIQTLLYSIFSALGFWIFSNWIPRLKFNVSEIKSIFKFSSNLVAFNFLNYFSRNSDQIIIGRFFSSATLGQYSLAYRLMLFPIQNITFVLTRSLYPILSRSQSDDKGSFNIYIQTLRVISIVIPPLMLGLATVSHEFVIVFLGGKWSLVSTLLIWLAPVAIMQSMVSTTGSVFMARAKTNILLYISIYNAVLQIGAFIIGGFYDINTLVKLYLIANVLMFFPNMFLAIRVLKGNYLFFIKVISKPIIFSLVMATAIYIYSFLISNMPISVIIIFITKVLVGTVVYITCLLIWERDIIFKLIKR
ncbi:lipopolysaccharide biosynthesis protein [Klebsiella variicola]|uniref:lipopolysaccharide biosynthesis protein n=2 Tax=Klebsiella variicola TaxID=244366 RepID=UPI000E2D3BFC|nr:lipopolysaccharide biosynthesis protein [Klebsiella variicola]HCB0127820.1 lipopolysaccharide biosynthesis protein [Klebsiella variicola subsp. variicola]ELA3609523.1 lipopolysaccharide biosynthesis protein [Klebsiella variicola]ELI8992372.1 lipopolysaccharide biosynthesis protein [Klebsiella variicola]EMA4730087.1 lipopolysaccharide biosynthesis protein [Klebsiella variicola]MBX8856262.1 lipopolysaccharide biosynthesis protein [Klebsiella variicola]